MRILAVLFLSFVIVAKTSVAASFGSTKLSTPGRTSLRTLPDSPTNRNVARNNIEPKKISFDSFFLKPADLLDQSQIDKTINKKPDNWRNYFVNKGELAPNKQPDHRDQKKWNDHINRQKWHHDIDAKKDNKWNHHQDEDDNDNDNDDDLIDEDEEDTVDIIDMLAQGDDQDEDEDEDGMSRNFDGEPVDVDEDEEKPVDVSENDEEPVDVSDNDEEPVDVSDNDEEPVDVDDQSDATSMPAKKLVWKQWLGNKVALACAFRTPSFSVEKISARKCGAACTANDKCTHFSYANNKCYLKSSQITDGSQVTEADAVKSTDAENGFCGFSAN